MDKGGSVSVDTTLKSKTSETVRVYVGGVYLASDSLTVGLILLYVKARLVGAQDIDEEWVYTSLEIYSMITSYVGIRLCTFF